MEKTLDEERTQGHLSTRGDSPDLKDLRHLKDEELIERLKRLTHEERRMTLEILNHLREIERRQLFLEYGFGSLFDYCVQELGYSSASAFRRISAMRLLRTLPEVENQVASGVLTLSTLARVQSVFQAERTKSGQDKLIAAIAAKSIAAGGEVKSSPSLNDAKGLLLTSLAGRSAREVERTLAALSISAAFRETRRSLNAELTELRLILKNPSMDCLDRLRNRLAHRLRENGSYSEVVATIAEMTAENLEVERSGKKIRERNVRVDSSVPTSEVQNGPNKSGDLVDAVRESHTGTEKGGRSRYVPQALRRVLRTRSGGRCEFVAVATGARCNSENALEIDHIQPFALGGRSDRIENLRVVCRAHNQWYARRTFGEKVPRRKEVLEEPAKEFCGDQVSGSSQDSSPAPALPAPPLDPDPFRSE